MIEIHKLVKHFSDEEIDKVAATYHAWRGVGADGHPLLNKGHFSLIASEVI